MSGVSLIVAAAANDVIGRAGDLPWHLPADLRRFRSLTDGHVVLAGRVTHDSIVTRLGCPLPGRITVVITRAGPADAGRPAGGGVRYVMSLAAALAAAAEATRQAGRQQFFVIGGASVYQQALPFVDRLYLTRIHQPVPGDRAMPAGWLSGFELVSQQDVVPQAGQPGYSWLDYRRARP
jgi:dihydrofolate reductase